jgi:epoxide hydrolase 4
MSTAVNFSFIETNGLRLHTVQAGPEDGPLVILLHGFPEFWYGWRGQIGPLAAAGFRVLAPDLRGYNLSEKPRELQAYRLNHVVADVLGLIQASGREKASLVGHDWGGAVAWGLAALHPGRLERLAVLNIPYPAGLAGQLFLHPDQFLRSAYVSFFQLPWLPEAMLRNEDWRMVVQGLEATSRPGTFSEDDFEHYRQAWWREGAMRAMLNWYRAFLRFPPAFPPRPVIEVPTLILWGVQDAALNPNLAKASLELCARGRLVYFADATHWLQHEEPERVNELLLEFLSSAPSEMS